MAHHKRLAALQRGVLRIGGPLCYNKHESPRIGMKQGAGRLLRGPLRKARPKRS